MYYHHLTRVLDKGMYVYCLIVGPPLRICRVFVCLVAICDSLLTHTEKQTKTYDTIYIYNVSYISTWSTQHAST